MPDNTLVEEVARAICDASGYDWTDQSNRGLCGRWNTLAQAAVSIIEQRVRELEEALRSIHAARLHNGKDEGYGWSIIKLNRAMDAALPLIGKPVPPKPDIDVAALKAAITGPFNGGSDNHGS